MEHCPFVIGLILANPDQFTTWTVTVPFLPSLDGGEILAALARLLGLLPDTSTLDSISVGRTRCYSPQQYAGW